MGSELTFYFKTIFPSYEKFKEFMTDFEVADLMDVENELFAKYIYKILFREYAHSNIQYDTPEDFKLDLAQIVEDNFDRYKKQVELIKKMQALTDEQILTLTKSLSNHANNPNSEPNDPTKPLNFISAQTYSQITDNQLQGYLKALELIPTKRIKELVYQCKPLFKKYIPNQVFVYVNEEED